MSYRELTMIDVREVLRRWQAKQSARQIARETGIDRKTVGRYTATAEKLGLPRDRALSDDEIRAVAQREQARPLPDPSAEWKAVAEHRARIEAWLGGARPLRLRKIHILLERDGLIASYATLRSRGLGRDARGEHAAAGIKGIVRAARCAARSCHRAQPAARSRLYPTSLPSTRFRRDAVHIWTLEFATHTGSWEKTGFRVQLRSLLALVTPAFPWTIAPIE
jgi:hypothetical protein